MIRSLNGGRARLLFVILIGSVCLGGCVNGEPNSTDLFKANRPPIANAGPDQSVPRGASVRLEGSGSDPDGDDFRYEWRIVGTPRGSGAQLDTPASPVSTFVADTDGIYRIELRVIEELDQNIPEGAPIDDTGATSEPDEVVVIAGSPGPFDNSANKLILDGKNFALSTTVIDLQSASDLTAEGWFLAAEAPPPGPEALLMGKKDFFEIVLTESAGFLFRFALLEGGTVTVGPLPFTLNEWHHVAAVIDQQESGSDRAYLVLDGILIAAANFTGSLKENSNRFTVGGGEGSAFFVGMADEIRVTQDVRYPEATFDPPKDLLISDSPFVAGARFTVHGLWHFDEFVGAELFTDFSLRNNDLFLVGEIGFQPFGRLDIPRRFHTVTALADESLLVVGGLDDAGRPVTETEQIRTDDQLDNLAPINIVKVTNEAIATGDGTKKNFTFTLKSFPLVSDSGPDPIAPGDDRRVVVTAGNQTVTDNSVGGWTGGSGTIDYETGEIDLTFSAAPGIGTPITATYFYNRGSGVYYHTATKLNDGRVLVAGGADKDKKLFDRALIFDPAVSNSVVETAGMVLPRRAHTAALLSDGRVMLVGGETDNPNESVTTLRETERFNSTDLTFTAGPSLTAPRKFHRMIPFQDCKRDPQSPPDDRLLIIGGYDETNRPLRTAEIYSGGGNGGFFLTGSMSVGRVRHAVACLTEEKILVTGGIDASGHILNSAEIYDLATGLFTPLQVGMNSPRANHSATLLPNGKVLIAGGFDQSGQGLASAEIYDPEQNLFTPLSNRLGLARYDHLAVPWKSAILGKDGVLLIGGGNEIGSPTSLLEIFYP
jgi:hypothetical protein